MSDTTDYYIKLRRRSSKLHEQLDRIIYDLISAERDVTEMAHADLDLSGELAFGGSVDQHDLEKSVAEALYFSRQAERINNEHRANVDHALRKFSIDPLSIDDDGHTA